MHSETTLAPQMVTMMVGGVPVDLCTEDLVLDTVKTRLSGPQNTPLAIGSVNLDHLHHFTTPGGPRLDHPAQHGEDGVDWLLLADGAPIVARATKLTGRPWPRLTGADLLPAILHLAEQAGSRVGFYGGYANLHVELDAHIKQDFPGLGAVHYWSPHRNDLDDPRSCLRDAKEIRAAGIDVLVVGLGKPRQEMWIEHFGTLTGCRALLAFGAAADFLAGTAQRAPVQLQRLGLEWLHRLGSDPRRLARRYLIEGPPELLTLRRAEVAQEFRSVVATTTKTVSFPVSGRGGQLSSNYASAFRSELPGAKMPPNPTSDVALGAVIVPAHNESAVIGRTLEPLAAAAESGAIELIVVCNGCTDGTADAARAYAGVTVVEIDQASKIAALNRGDATATLWPRLYLDADTTITMTAVDRVFAKLRSGDVLAARPSSEFNVAGADVFVRSYYRARSRIEWFQTAMWGAGAYGLSEAGHQQIGEFPMLTGDDLWVDAQFTADEKTVVDTEPTTVAVPRDLDSLLHMLQRVYRGKAEVAEAPPAGRTLRAVLTSIRGPRSAWDSGVYVALTIIARRRMGRSRTVSWERDDSSRVPVAA